MNKCVTAFSILVVITLFLTSCGTWVVQAQPEEQATPKVVLYQTLLGKSVKDTEVADFIVSNSCSSANQFLLCRAVGIALWIDSQQIVKTVYLYLHNADGFRPYEGELPFGLKFYDTMGAVVYKLKRQGVGNDGVPDEGSAPDHLHYRAVYQQAGITLLYNSPFADEDATIYAVLVNS